MDALKAEQQNKRQLPVLNRLTDIFAVGKFDYSVIVRYQNLTRKPELFWAPLGRGAGTSKGQGGGAVFSRGTFNTVRTVITTNIAELVSNN